jgi:uncharacterized alkaline shock family protein YloU
VSGPDLKVSHAVIAETIRLAAFEVPGIARVGRRGPAWRSWLAGSPVETRIANGLLDVRVLVIARPAQPIGPLAVQVREAVGAAVSRLLRMEPGTVTVLIDGVGA